MTETYDWLCKMLVAEYKIEPSKLALDAPLADLGIDSLGMAELLFNVEDEFGITLPPEPVELPTVGDVVRFIDALILASKTRPDAPEPGVAGPSAGDTGLLKPDPS
ncbi:acyl carrier protein [Polaromonas sp.]|uniref:acyl carrier protein n=1 Tax=Polaromonas sp. TaxID=1869339 RepID=UPI0025CECA89|nr:acyl carrier protein [Polaromonas sp.]